MWSFAGRRREASAKYEHWRISSKNSHGLGRCLPQMAPDTTPHFHALSQGKQTEPCSAGTWLVLPPLLWIIWRAVSTRGMELALTGVDFTSSNTSLKVTSNSTSANALKMSEQPIKMCCIAQGVASCLTYLYHQNHFSDDCPNDVTPMWV